MTLFEIDRKIAEAIEKLFDSVDEETGEVDAGSAKELDELQEARNAKLDGCGAYIKNLDAEVEALKAEAKKLTERARIKQNRADRLREYVSMALTSAGQDKFESNRVVFSFRTSQQVRITSEAELPEEYWKTKTEKSPDKDAIKKALKAGQEITGAELVNNRNLQVK